jgi:hypothetical protein
MMNDRLALSVLTVSAILIGGAGLAVAVAISGPLSAREWAVVTGPSDDPSPPAEPVKLVFIHHSCGGNWLADVGEHDQAGGLGQELMSNNYFVSATNYGWGPGSIGSNTDIPDWPDWFTGPSSSAILEALYSESGQNICGEGMCFGDWSRLATDPGGENEIVMFKSCYPNSDVYGNPDDPPGSAPNGDFTVSNFKAVYDDLLTYFETRQDKLFIVITAPPMAEASYVANDAYTPAAGRAANARAFNDWLVSDWLAGYAHSNLAVFDFYNVLTSNGSSQRVDDTSTNEEPNDYDSRPDGNHHYWNGSEIVHAQTVENDFSAYPYFSVDPEAPDPWCDDHPTAAGNRKATAEFVPLLNVFYNRWKGGSVCKAISSVNITGPTGGYTDTLYAFTADHTPPGASTPITYTWSPEPDAGTGVVVSYAWATTGTKTIIVTAENCGGSAMDSHTIAIKTKGRYRIYLPLILKSLTSTPTLTPTLPPSGDLIQPSDLVYQGAFAYPLGDEWAYSGHALAYYPDGDPGSGDGYPGSLYAAGSASDEWDLVGEMTIPEPVISVSFDDLPKASVLQSLADITGGWKDNCTYNDDCIYRNVDDLAYLRLPNGVEKIAWNLRDWYNVAAYDQDSLGWSDLDMTGAQGVWHIGERPSEDNLFHNAKACNYLFKAPESFADENLDGKWLIAGNHREAGALGGSQGPTLYALAPWEDGNPPTSGQNLDSMALLYYPEIIECVWEAEEDINEHPDPGVCHFPDYRAMDNWGGGVWLQTTSGSGILIFGRKGLGDNCYGSTALCGEDPCAPSSGYHAYPYEPRILFYDPEELTEVLAGTREPWEVLPYGVHTVEEVLDRECAALGAAAYDQERGLIYVTEQEAGPWGETVVHVWRVE